MKRVCEIMKIMFNSMFWMEFFEQDMREESRIMYDYE